MELVQKIKNIPSRVLKNFGYYNVPKNIIEKSKAQMLTGSQTGGLTQLKGLKGYKAISKKGLSFQQLRAIAMYDAVIRVCINTIKKEVSQCDWSIVPRDKFTGPVEKKQIDEVTKFFSRLNSEDMSMETHRVLLDRILEDLLTLDAAAVEVVRDVDEKIIGMHAVDAATIKPLLNKQGEFDPKKAYVQQIGGSKEPIYFASNELIYMMENPQTNINKYGYGTSVIESIIMAVNASLQADMYNLDIFSKDNIPPGILDLGDMSNEEAQHFIAMWNNTVVNNTQKLKFMWGSKESKKYIPFKTTNKDMQYIEYTDWLSRVKLAVYGLTSMDANITQDINRSTSANQSRNTQVRGIKSRKKLIEEYWNTFIVWGSFGYEDIAFRFKDTADIEEEKLQAEIDKIYVESGVLNVDDIRSMRGFPERTEEEKNEAKVLDEPKVIDDYQEPQVVAEKSKKVEKKTTKRFFPPLYK